jgi:hypothetical protein
MRSGPIPNQEGVITRAPQQALVCPRRNAFGTPSLGVLQAVSFFQNYQFCLGQQPKPQIGLLLFSGLWFSLTLAIEPPAADECKFKFVCGLRTKLFSASHACRRAATLIMSRYCL